MADEGMTLGEIQRTLARMDQEHRDDQRATDDRLTQVAAQMVSSTLFSSAIQGLQTSDAEIKAELRAGFKRVEATSIERRDALMRKDKELGERIDGIEKGRAPRVANWIAAVVAGLTAVGLIVTLLSQGGR